MAIASRWLAETYNRPGYDLFDLNVYSICGDGDMMEGISSEAASVAGHLRLSNLCWIYDSNRVTIEGHTDITFTEDVAARFLAYGWEVIRVTDPNDIEMLERAYRRFLATGDRPTLIVVHSHIGYGAPHKQDSPSAHGEPLGPEEVRLTKEFFGFSPDETFVVPPGVREHFAATMGARGFRLFGEWEQLFARYRAQYPDLADQIECLNRRELPPDWEKALPTFPTGPAGMATRDASGKVLNALAEKIPWLIGGSADLAPSNKTRLTFEFAGDFQRQGPSGCDINWLWQRGVAVRTGIRAPDCRRRKDASRQHARMGTVRRTGSAVPGQCAAAIGHGTGHCGRGFADWLGAIRRTRRRGAGYAHFRHVGTDEGRGRTFWLYS